MRWIRHSGRGLFQVILLPGGLNRTYDVVLMFERRFSCALRRQTKDIEVIVAVDRENREIEIERLPFHLALVGGDKGFVSSYRHFGRRFGALQVGELHVPGDFFGPTSREAFHGSIPMHAQSSEGKVP